MCTDSHTTGILQMQFRFFWRKRRMHVSAEERIVRFRRILQSAQSVSQYRRSLQVADLDSPDAIRKVGDLADALQRLAVQPEKLTFRVDSERPTHTHEFQHPLALHSRTAIVAPDIAAAGEDRAFTWRQDARDIEAFRPESLAAGVFTLARDGDRDTSRAPSSAKAATCADCILGPRRWRFERTRSR